MAVCGEEDRGEGTNSFESTKKSVNRFLLSADTAVTLFFVFSIRI